MSKIVNIEEYRKMKEMRIKYFEEDHPELDGLTLADLEEDLSSKDTELLKQIGIPMVEFDGSTLKEWNNDLS